MSVVEQVVRGYSFRFVLWGYALCSVWERFILLSPIARRNRYKTETGEGEIWLGYWFFEKNYLNLCFMHGGTRQIRALEFVLRQRKAVRNPLFVRRDDLETFAVSTKFSYCQYVCIPILARLEGSSHVRRAHTFSACVSNLRIWRLRSVIWLSIT